ncbi:Rab-GDP dissociation inhibitor [Spraguea lophii 42_110]|uniref:Rab-GDP dissociation inhibitor n=1 Tax=Spraguea lophii (strain 42_110) TaxID=1358809 RepID=S7W666_SPRLO|nr:Rab-GDP dissociation inhibitor [Spraguea lophii 42_110]
MIFDILFEGTTINECLEARTYLPREVIIIDKCGTYGSTHNIKKLKNCHHIKNLKIKKLEVDNFLVETVTPLLRPDAKILSEIKIPISYIYLDEIIVINDIKYKIPYSKYDIATSNYLSLEEKFSLNKAITQNSHQCNEIIDIVGLENIQKYFNTKPYVYPRYGMKEISEQLSRLNAFTNISYCLSDIQIEEDDNKKYFTYNNEKVYFKKYVERKEKEKYYFKVLVSKKQLLPRNSIVKYLRKDVTALSVDEVSKAVPVGYKIFTFWSNKKFMIQDIENISQNDIYSEIEYEGYNEIYK